jgi:hypothetical protein
VLFGYWQIANRHESVKLKKQERITLEVQKLKKEKGRRTYRENRSG